MCLASESQTPKGSKPKVHLFLITQFQGGCQPAANDNTASSWGSWIPKSEDLIEIRNTSVDSCQNLLMSRSHVLCSNSWFSMDSLIPLKREHSWCSSRWIWRQRQNAALPCSFPFTTNITATQRSTQGAEGDFSKSRSKQAVSCS